MYCCRSDSVRGEIYRARLPGDIVRELSHRSAASAKVSSAWIDSCMVWSALPAGESAGPFSTALLGAPYCVDTLRQERSAMTSSLSIRLFFVNPQDVVVRSMYIFMILEKGFRQSAVGVRPPDPHWKWAAIFIFIQSWRS